MLNAIGLQNPGVDHVVRNILPTLDFTETRFIANVCGSTIEEYAEVTRRFDDSPIDAMEINISCPNVKEGGVQFGNYPGDVGARGRGLPQGDEEAAHHQAVAEPDRHPRERAALHRGRHATGSPSSTRSWAWRSTSRRGAPVIGNVQGGLSGPAIKPIALLKVQQVYEVAGRSASRSSARAASRRATDAHRVPDRGRERPSASAPRFSTIRCSAARSTRASRNYLRGAGMSSVAELTGSLVNSRAEDCGN